MPSVGRYGVACDLVFNANSESYTALCRVSQRHTVTIEGDEVHLDWSAGAHITMNPGYLGRSELPEGLKSLFRPITVMVPDLVLICENMLSEFSKKYLFY